MAVIDRHNLLRARFEGRRRGLEGQACQPADAEILVDGERWTTTPGQEQIAIRLPEGRHRIEVSRAGYARYVEDVLIRVNRGLTVNVSLKGN